MHTKEHIEQKIQDLKLQKERILRGFGGRYSRRINGIKYNPEKHNSKKQWLQQSFISKKRAFNRINDKKQELRDIDSKLYDLYRELSKLETEKPLEHSERFNREFKNIMDTF